MQEMAAGRPVFEVDFAPGEIRVYGNEETLSPEYLQGKKVLAFAGIAKPDSFSQTLLKIKAEIAGLEKFPDHYRYDRQDAERLWQKATQLRVEGLVTTESGGTATFTDIKMTVGGGAGYTLSASANW
jgi:tetraacyldisaccharide-1-P 4'-kinase